LDESCLIATSSGGRTGNGGIGESDKSFAIDAIADAD
jgi:hypothetical protein